MLYFHLTHEKLTFLIKTLFIGSFILITLFTFNLLAKAQEINTSSTINTTTSTTNEQTLSSSEIDEQRKNLESKLEEIEKKMVEQEKVIEEHQHKERTLENEIYSINAQTRKLNLKLEAVDISLQKLNNDIYETQRHINKNQNKIKTHKEALGSSLQNIYELDNQTLIVIFLQNNKMSDFFNSINEILLVQNNIQASLSNIIKLRENLIKQKQEINLERGDVTNLKNIRENQKNQLQYTKSHKSNLLQKTKNQESKYQEILAETKKTAAEIRSSIFQLIGGGELTFEKAYELAKLAEGATNVRAALTLAILSRESLLGKNVGQCSYKTDMHPKRDIPVFKTIIKNLELEDNTTVIKISCANQHGSYGGAMGPAQFIPSTWAIYGGYRKTDGKWEYKSSKDQIGDITGNKPSNPWSNEDAFSATSIYINELIQTSGCQDYANQYDYLIPHQKLLERCAAAKYYAGSRWWTYRFWYGDAVVEKAEELQKDIDILNK